MQRPCGEKAGTSFLSVSRIEIQVPRAETFARSSVENKHSDKTDERFSESSFRNQRKNLFRRMFFFSMPEANSFKLFLLSGEQRSRSRIIAPSPICAKTTPLAKRVKTFSSREKTVSLDQQTICIGEKLVFCLIKNAVAAKRTSDVVDDLQMVKNTHVTNSHQRGFSNPVKIRRKRKRPQAFCRKKQIKMQRSVLIKNAFGESSLAKKVSPDNAAGSIAIRLERISSPFPPSESASKTFFLAPKFIVRIPSDRPNRHCPRRQDIFRAPHQCLGCERLRDLNFLDR